MLTLRGNRRWTGTLAVAALVVVAGAVGLPPSAAAEVPYRQDDYAQGQAFAILPPGEHGLYNAADIALFELFGTRPAGSSDQYPKYENLIYGFPSLDDAHLSTYFNEASFGVKPGELTRTETPDPAQPVKIYRDKSDVPHIYGATDAATEFGAGYAAAEDRLFMMDVLRHFGRGTLSSFLGPSCANEHMDHTQLLLTGYTDADLQAQFDAIPQKFGAAGLRFTQLVSSYVDGINAYVRQTGADVGKLPADYASVVATPHQWSVRDVIAVAGLVGGIFGQGGGGELRNAALLQYLTRQIGAAQARPAFDAFRSRNDPLAPTTIRDKAFPYDIPGQIDPATTALPDDATRPLTGVPTDTTAHCDLFAANVPALKGIASLLTLPKKMSNALVVDGRHSASGHPTAVFGPQVGYFAPQILMEQELHGPTLVASGVSFAGTSMIVEMGRGMDFAWSATSSGTDNTDVRLERLCDPAGGAVDAQSKYYVFQGSCRAMRHQRFSQLALPKPGGVGAPVQLDHDIYYTVHGPVQGWTTSGGKPVAVSLQRSTYAAELDSGVGFLAWNTPAQTHDAASFIQGAAQVDYTFNWFYVDDTDIAYFSSGRAPVRPGNVDPNLPTWGDGTAEWQGFLPAAAHPQQTNPAAGFFTSWNNKPAPMWSAADSQYGYGSTFRSVSLDDAIAAQFAAHGGKITRANLVQAMESAAGVDLSGSQVLPDLLAYLPQVTLDAQGTAMVAQLRSWLAGGAVRRKATHAATQYQHAAAVAISDELYPRLVRALFDPLFAAGGVHTYRGLPYSYNALPQDFANTPNNQGVRRGSAYDGGWESYLQTVLRQLRGASPADAFPAGVTGRLCGTGGMTACPAAIATAFKQAAAALTAANSTSNVAAWTASTASKDAGVTMPAFDAIAYQATGIAGQPDSDWQNRPTFQQVVTFPAHRPR
jgi:acyl-homoserine lactone acylase PvdQ